MLRRVSRLVCLLAAAGWASLGAVAAAVASPPDNDYFVNAMPASPLPFTDSGDLNGTTTELGEFQFFNCSPMQQTVWYRIESPSAMALIANLAGSDPGVMFNVWQTFPGGGLNTLGFVGCTFVGGSVQFTTQPGSVYYIQAGSTFTGSAHLQLNVQQVPPPANDAFAAATAIAAASFVDPVDLTSATIEPGEPQQPSGAFTPIAGSAWYSFTPDVTRSVTANLGSCCVSPILTVYTGGALQSLSEVGSRSFGQPVTFQAVAGTTYYIQVGRGFISGGTAQMQFRLDLTPPPTANMSYFPFDPSAFDTVQFMDMSFDPGQVGIASQSWLFGDGTTGSGNFVSHRYAADGDYTVQLTVATPDGRSASTSQVVHVRTHDVAVLKLVAPNSARAGQTKEITASVRNTFYPENVQFQLLKSVPGTGFQVVGTLTQLIPVRQSNKTVPVTLSYTFSADDAAVGKVTFEVTAQLVSARDALPADNTAIAAPTRVSP